jgi:hypothetical protein
MAKKKKKRKSSAPRAGKKAKALTNSSTVPAANVGAAVQAAVSAAGATNVTADATDATRQTYLVSWG